MICCNVGFSVFADRIYRILYDERILDLGGANWLHAATFHRGKDHPVKLAFQEVL